MMAMMFYDSYFNGRPFQIIDQLGFVTWMQGIYSFNFHQHLLGYNQIGAISSNFPVFVKYFYRLLLHHGNSTFVNFQHEGVFINFFQKSVTQCIVHLIESTEDYSGQAGMKIVLVYGVVLFGVKGGIVKNKNFAKVACIFNFGPIAATKVRNPYTSYAVVLLPGDT